MGNQDNIIFGIKTTFPDAQAIFSHSLLPVEKTKHDCLVVLDTNVLLLPYDTGKSSLDQISKIYQYLIQEKRLVIPGQVAREFAKNRGRKISELFQQISRKRNNASLKNEIYPLLESLQEYQDTMKLETEINEKLDIYRKSIGRLIEKILDWQWSDPVSIMYKELFAKDVVVDIDFNNEEIEKDLIRRNEQKIPPGYKDAEKSDAGIGDLVIWHTILDIAEKHSKNVIFVSGDEKTDWQIRSENQALYPRYELIDEFRRRSSGATFHILSFSRFLDLFGVSENVVAEVREKEIQQSEADTWDSESNFISLAMDSVRHWLLWNYPEQEVINGKNNIDLEIVYKDGSKIGVDLKVSSNFSPSLIKNLINKNTFTAKTYNYKNIILTIVTREKVQAEKILRMIPTIDYSDTNIALLIGYLSKTNQEIRFLYFK